MELLGRIERDLLTAASLARQSGLQQPHISNFLRSRRRLSLPALDRILAALQLSVEDLLPPTAVPEPRSAPAHIPLVSSTSAMHDAYFTSKTASETFELPTGSLSDLRPRQGVRRNNWERFVAVGLTPEQAAPMDPRFSPNDIVVIDRHYNSLVNYRPPQLNIYAVRLDNTMLLRYVSFEANRLILRPHSLASPVQLIEIEAHRSPSDPIVGRICFVLSRL